MANGFGGLYIGTSGLQSAQNALNVTANNLANIDTKGYVRERTTFADKDSILLKNEQYRVMMQQSGLGVSIGDVVHARDIFLDKAFRTENGRRSFYQVCYDTVGQMEDIMQELDGVRFKQSITDLEKAFQELAKAPADSVNQNLIVQKAELLISRSDAIYKSTQAYQTSLNGKIGEQVNRINEIGQRVWELNIYIQKIEAGSQETAMTYRDERDSLLDELSGYADITTTEDQFGFVTVTMEGVDFIEEKGFNAIGLKSAYGTGFYTPYWPQLSDLSREEYVPVFRTNVDFSTENNNDIGSVKSLLYQRGDSYGRYRDLESMEAYKEIQDCVPMEVQAQLDLLFHSIITTFNDIFCPNIEAENDITDAAGNVVIPAGTKILDTANCPVGVDKELPPRELFSRVGCERYREVEVDGTTYYVFNEEDPDNSDTHYAIGSVHIEKELSKQATLLPGYYQNGAVYQPLGHQFIAAWENTGMTLNPTDNYPVNFLGYYDKLLGNLGTTGGVYKSATDTLDNTVNSLDNQRLQVTGVSSDEELTQMIKYQAAYNAASRFITVVSEMTELIVTGLK